VNWTYLAWDTVQWRNVMNPDTKSSGSIKENEFLVQLSDYRLVKDGFPPLS
jgi:hypothetical protein